MNAYLSRIKIKLTYTILYSQNQCTTSKMLKCLYSVSNGYRIESIQNKFFSLVGSRPSDHFRRKPPSLTSPERISIPFLHSPFKSSLRSVLLSSVCLCHPIRFSVSHPSLSRLSVNYHYADILSFFLYPSAYLSLSLSLLASAPSLFFRSLFPPPLSIDYSYLSLLPHPFANPSVYLFVASVPFFVRPLAANGLPTCRLSFCHYRP